MSPTALPDANPLPQPGSVPRADGQQANEHRNWNNWYLARDQLSERNNGRLEQAPPSDCETWPVCLGLQELIGYLLHARPVGQVVGPGMGFRLALAATP